MTSIEPKMGGGGGEPEVMSLEERKKRLSFIARADFNRQLHPASAIIAIDTLNKMDNLYKQRVEVVGEVIHTFTFVLPDGTKFIPGLPAKASPTQLSEPAITIEDGTETT